MKKWEYRVATRTEEVKDLGAEGFRVATAFADEDDLRRTVFLMERRVREDEPLLTVKEANVLVKADTRISHLESELKYSRDELLMLAGKLDVRGHQLQAKTEELESMTAQRDAEIGRWRPISDRAERAEQRAARLEQLLGEQTAEVDRLQGQLDSRNREYEEVKGWFNRTDKRNEVQAQRLTHIVDLLMPFVGRDHLTDVAGVAISDAVRVAKGEGNGEPSGR